MKIVAAAVKYLPTRTDKNCPQYKAIIISSPAPARHSDILIPMSQMHPTAAHEAEQGFLTDTGEFLGRIGAKQLVRDTKQPTIRNTHQTELFSEDLW
jgi:hypothetical protein